MNYKEFGYDFFVIGGGSGGVRAARVAASLGARVALAEERYFGGTCVNVGCVPKKLMSYAASFRDSFEDSQGFGWISPAPRFEWSSFKEGKDKEIIRLEGIYKSLLESSGVSVFKQRARLTGAHTVQMGQQVVQQLPADLLIIGGGYIAVEFASILGRLGCAIRVNYRGEWLLNGFDSDLRQHFTRELGKNHALILNRKVSKIVKKK
ncbi:MAG: glutathione-disulfide reductase [Pseudomonadota bacterium]|jgi:glutathione reductase (NADPH)